MTTLWPLRAVFSRSPALPTVSCTLWEERCLLTGDDQDGAGRPRLSTQRSHEPVPARPGL